MPDTREKRKKNITDVFIELAELPELRVRPDIVKLVGFMHTDALGRYDKKKKKTWKEPIKGKSLGDTDGEYLRNQVFIVIVK